MKTTKKKAKKKVSKEYTVGKNKPPLHSRFKPGVSGNPLGGKLHDKGQIKNTIRNLTAEQVAELYSHCATLDVKGLKNIYANQKASVLMRTAAHALVIAMNKGDMSVIELLLNRIVGKSKDHIELTGSEGGPLETSEEARAERKARLKIKAAMLDKRNAEKS